jgi:hypothetical protein
MAMCVTRCTSRSLPLNAPIEAVRTARLAASAASVANIRSSSSLHRHDPGAEDPGLAGHAVAQGLRRRPLSRGQAQSLRVLQHVHGPRIAIQFCRKSEAHAPSLKKSRCVLLGQCFGPAPLQTRIGLRQGTALSGAVVMVSPVRPRVLG